LNILSNYFYGLADCDRELRRLTDYLQGLGEPAVVLYYGDHTPSFGDGIERALRPDTGDPAGDAIKRYKVPFIIWGNDAYRETGGGDAQPLDMGMFSANYLGVKLFSMLGFDGIDPYFDFCLDLMDEYPIILGSRYIDKDGALHSIGLDDDHDLNLYRSWGYYLLTQ
jgi:hypothetical protein